MTSDVLSPWRTEMYRGLAEPLSGFLGAPTAKALAGLGLEVVGDLVNYVPRRLFRGTETSDLASVREGDDIAVIARVTHVRPHLNPGRGASRVEATLVDDHGGCLAMTLFGRGRYVENWVRQLKRASRGIFIGKVGQFRGMPQMTHPSFVLMDDAGDVLGRDTAERERMAHSVQRHGLFGIYRQSAKASTWLIAECVDQVLMMLAGAPDPMPPELRDELGLMELRAAQRAAHFPDSLPTWEEAKRRLRFDEALGIQVLMARRAQRLAAAHTSPITRRPGGIVDRFDASLPFELTDGQREVGEQIFTDLASEVPMQRLLQGEVGSGKTVVALRAMLAAVDAGRQAALMAPTEVLAHQHFDSMCRMLGPLVGGGMCVTCLTGSMPASRRRGSLEDIASGKAGIVVGTHALLSDVVTFHDLGLVVVDEQHRFGVTQRAEIHAKARVTPHSLVLTATPIPRSIAMTVFGDLQVSTLSQMPSGRGEVQTTLVEVATHPAWLDRAWERMREEVEAGHQAFVVCPKIEGAEGSVEVWSLRLKQLVPELRIGALHGKMDPDEKNRVMAAFAAGDIDVLVATTVIEVGVDVPNATMMVIMDADQFGISQLHQLRGRVGRGGLPGLCLLVTRGEAAERLAHVAATNDGFALAAEDLAQRREGDVLGDRQTGTRSALRIVSVTEDVDLIERARGIARRLVEADPSSGDPWLADMEYAIASQASQDWMDAG